MASERRGARDLLWLVALLASCGASVGLCRAEHARMRVEAHLERERITEALRAREGFTESLDRIEAALERLGR